MGPVARLLRWRRVCVNARNTRTNTHTHTRSETGWALLGCSTEFSLGCVVGRKRRHLARVGPLSEVA